MLANSKQESQTVVVVVVFVKTLEASFNQPFFKNGPIPASFVYFRSFLVTISIQIEKSIDGVLGIQTRGRWMVGADETTELWRPL